MSVELDWLFHMSLFGIFGRALKDLQGADESSDLNGKRHGDVEVYEVWRDVWFGRGNVATLHKHHVFRPYVLSTITCHIDLFQFGPRIISRELQSTFAFNSAGPPAMPLPRRGEY